MQHEYPLQIVEEVARAGSIRGAADLLSITPSALNRRLLNLESELDTQLFERLSNGVRLNPAGEIFISHARRQLADMKSVRSKIADLKGVRRGRVVIAVDDNIANIGSVANEVADYQIAFPGVAFSVEPAASDDTALAVMEYRADLVVQLHPRTNAHIASLCSAPVEVRVFGRKDHPALGHGPVRLHEVCHLPWALPARGPLRHAIESSAMRQGLDYRIGLEATASFASATITSSDAIGFNVTLRTDQTPNWSSHSMLSPNDYSPMFVHLSQAKGRTLSVAAGRFAEQVRKSYAAL